MQSQTGRSNQEAHTPSRCFFKQSQTAALRKTHTCSLDMKTVLFSVMSLVLCGLLCDVTGVPIKLRSRSPPLKNPDTHQRVRELAEHAQKLDNNTDTRLMPPASYTDNQTKLYVCCLHANILDFYLRNILTTNEIYPHLSTVKSELHRVSRDLQGQGCQINHVKDHEHSKRFKSEFFKLGSHGETKAIGEIDILFDYLTRFC